MAQQAVISQFEGREYMAGVTVGVPLPCRRQRELQHLERITLTWSVQQVGIDRKAGPVGVSSRRIEELGCQQSRKIQFGLNTELIGVTIVARVATAANMPLIVTIDVYRELLPCPKGILVTRTHLDTGTNKTVTGGATHFECQFPRLVQLAIDGQVQ